MGQDSLLIDLDPQANATSGLGFNKQDIECGIFQNLIDDVPLEKTINATGVELLDIVCSSPDMLSAEIHLSTFVSRENKLKEAIKPFNYAYSFIVIDCPPSLGLLTINALCAADRVLIPMQGEFFALEGLAGFFSAVKKIQTGLNPRLCLEGGILTMFDQRFALAKQVKAELEKFLGNTLFKTTIPRNVRLAEAPSFGKTIFEYDPRSKGGESYLELAGEFLGRRGWRGMKLN